MSFYYKLNEDAGDRHFIGVKTYENGVMESDEPINSPYVTEVQVQQNAEQNDAANPVSDATVVQPGAAPAPAQEQPTQPSGELN